MFGAKGRAERSADAADRERLARECDAEARECDRQIADLRVRGKGDPEAVAWGVRRLEAEKSTCEWNSRVFRRQV